MYRKLSETAVYTNTCIMIVFQFNQNMNESLQYCNHWPKSTKIFMWWWWGVADEYTFSCSHKQTKKYARNVCSPIVYSVEMKICRKKQSSYIFVIWLIERHMLLLAITYSMLPNQVFLKKGFLKADERLVLDFQRFSVETYVPILIYRM